MIARLNHRHVILVLFLCTVSALFFLPLIGTAALSLSELLGSAANETSQKILWKIRVPRVLLALFVGAGLSLSGLLFQAFFRNPLASPFTLGVSSAAALGAALYFKFENTLIPFSALGAPVAALLFSLLGIGLIYSLSLRGGGLAGTGILLAGVAVSFFCSSLVVFIQYLSDVSEIFSITRWLMGSLETVGYEKVALLAPTVVVSAVVCFGLGRELDLISIGDDFAKSRGVAVDRVRHVVFFLAALLVGVIVSLCGVIGFVGIMVPHMARALVGLYHRLLVPTVVLLGGLLVMLCDGFSRTAIAPSEIPVGVITSLIGGPFFLLLLMLPRTNRVPPNT